ncbi:MAG TPA: Tex-like N-terminal domain-containing protein, partial [Candidatus Hydrogenedentes bacterium]|nr:Tex-like N-terminal domain-containing protein [Candidatus Hydrogenedentota bacterium]
MIEQKFIERIAHEIGAQPEQVAVAVQLFDRGATVPFVAHYRRDLTGGLDEQALERIEDRNIQYTALTNRRNAILQNIEKQQPLTDALRDRILACHDPIVLEDLYLPYRRRRRTRASVAIEQRLGPLADYLWAQQLGMQSLESFASQFIDPTKSISSTEEALDGARAILTEKIAQDADARAFVREHMLKEGRITTAATK